MQHDHRRNRNRFFPSVAPLETRQMLSGVATDYVINGKWNSPALTYSVVPDGTDWRGHPSTLNADMTAKVGPAWEAQVDRALATWGAAAGITFRKVNDDGSPEGAGGKPQGDSRFGDIRIGGYDLGNPNILAQTYGPSNGTTVGGDLSFNTSFSWSSGRDIDLYSVALHESGHAIGLGHASDPGDVMFPQYTGAGTGLGLGDIAGARSLYGPPAASPAPPVLPTPVPPAVFDAPPEVQAGINAASTVGHVFTRPGFFADSDAGDTWTATVDYGDGSGVQSLPLNPDKTFTLSHVYTAPGKFTVAVTINDSQGGQGRGFFAVTVAPQGGATPSPVPPTPPVAAPVPPVVVVPQTPAQRRAANRAAQQAARQARRLAQQQARQQAREAARARMAARRLAAHGWGAWAARMADKIRAIYHR